MEGTNEKILEALKLLLEAKQGINEDTFKNATKEELKEYIELSEEIEAKLNYLINNK